MKTKYRRPPTARSVLLYVRTLCNFPFRLGVGPPTSSSNLARRCSRLSQSLETVPGGSWIASGSWSKYDGDSEGSAEAADGKLSRRGSGMSTSGVLIGRGPRKISFTDEADSKVTERKPENGKGNGLLLEAAFGDEVGVLRQPSIEEEDEQQVKSFSTPQEHRIQEEDKNSLTESKDVTESVVVEDAGVGGGSDFSTDKRIEMPSPKIPPSIESILEDSVVSIPEPVEVTKIEPVEDIKVAEHDEKVITETNSVTNPEPVTTEADEVEDIYRESERTYNSRQEYEELVLASYLEQQNTLTTSDDLSTTEVYLFAGLPPSMLHHIQNLYCSYGRLLTIALPLLELRTFICLSSMLILYAALLPEVEVPRW